MIYSYDIFDTLITRGVATPRGVFMVMALFIEKQSQLQFTKNFADRFWKIRVDCEKEARRQCGSFNEVNLSDIYRVVQKLNDLTNEQTEFLKQLEVEVEEVYINGVQTTIRDLMQCIQKNEKVVLISDMYLSKDQIKKLLVKVNSVFGTVPITVSCEANVNKRNGLYDYVYDQFQLKDLNWIHTGDDLLADCEAAKNIGIIVNYCPKKELLSWEKELFNENDLAWQLLCGASKIARLNHGESIAFHIGCSIGFAILFPYVKWVVEECEQNQLEHIFLLARDGFVMKPIFEQYCKKKENGIQIHYLCGSRQVWNEERVKKDIGLQQRIQSYIEQQIGSYTSIAFVDTKGSGITLNFLVNQFIKRPVHSFMMYCECKESVSDYIHMHAYWNTFSGIGILLTELLTRALHGKTVDYSLIDGKIQPVLKDDENILLKEYGYEEYIDGILETGKYLFQSPLFVIEKGNWNSIADQYLAYLNNLENETLLNWFGEMPFSDNYNGKEVVLKYAPKLTKNQLKCYEEGKDVRECGYSGISLELSLKRLSQFQKEQLQLNRELKRYQVAEENLAKNVVLYGAGKVGNQIYQQLKSNNRINLVCWVDRQFLKARKKGYPVDSIKVLKECKFDQVIIAVASSAIAEKVKADLKKRGILAEQCYWQDYRI